MKGILEFDLPEDNRDYKLAVHAFEISESLSDVEIMLRSYLKHYDLESVTSKELIEKIWEEFREIASFQLRLAE